MKRNYIPYRQDMLYHLSTLPRNIVSLNDHDNIAEFVLHDLCNERCFNINKAAYFVDSPDFDHCKGIAGFCQNESCPIDNIWQDPMMFTEHMKKASFNNQVRSIIRPSIKRNGEGWMPIALSLAKDLSFADPSIYMIDLKHDNHGIFLCDKVDTQYEQQDMINWLSLLGLCHIH